MSQHCPTHAPTWPVVAEHDCTRAVASRPRPTRSQRSARPWPAALAAFLLAAATTWGCGSDDDVPAGTGGTVGQGAGGTSAGGSTATGGSSTQGGAAGGLPVALPAPEVSLPLTEGEGQVVSAPGAVRTLRGLWEPDVHLRRIPADEAEGMAEIQARVARMRAAGFNAFMPIVYSQYVDAVRDPSQYQSSTPPAAWDALGRYIDEARAAGMEIHLWYSPITLKEPSRAYELVDHPEWCLAVDGECLLDSNGAPKAIELANDEARAWQVEAMRYLAERYRPDAIQLEEPYYHLEVTDIPSNDAFTEKYRDRFGTDPPPTGDWHVSAVKRQVIDGLGKELRAALLTVDGAIALHVNVATDFVIGTDDFDRTGLHPDIWVSSGWLDGWEPQIYFRGASLFADRLASWQTWLPGESPRPFPTHVTLIPGATLYFMGFGDENETAYAQMLVAEEGGSGAIAASGSALFSFVVNADYDTLAYVESDLAAHLPAPLQGTLGSSAADEPDSDPTWVEGPAGTSALHFDGDADFVRVPGAYAFDEHGSFTFATRLRMEPGARQELETFVSRGDWDEDSGYVWIFSRGDGSVSYQIANGEAHEAQSFQSDEMPALYDGQWHWLVVTQDRAARTITFYLDGIAYGVRAYDGWSRPAVFGDFYLGTYNGSTDPRYSLSGDLSDVRWYRRSLDAAQVSALMLGE